MLPLFFIKEGVIMTVEEIIKLIVEKGVEIGVIVYFMYYNNTTLKELKEVIIELKEAIIKMTTKEENLDERN